MSTPHPMLRSLVFTCLLEWPEFAAMEDSLGRLVVTDLTQRVHDEQEAGSTASVWTIFQQYQGDITANGTTEPGVLTRYAECLKIQAERTTS